MQISYMSELFFHVLLLFIYIWSTTANISKNMPWTSPRSDGCSGVGTDVAQRWSEVWPTLSNHNYMKETLLGTLVFMQKDASSVLQSSGASVLKVFKVFKVYPKSSPISRFPHYCSNLWLVQQLLALNSSFFKFEEESCSVRFKSNWGVSKIPK